MAAGDHGSLGEARAQMLALIADVADADLERVHSPLLSPLVWDLGHIAAFEDLWLAHRGRGLPLLRADLADVYDAFETPRAQRGDLAYLRRAEAERYMRDVRERVRGLDLLDRDPLVELVARHERQHTETMLQTLALAGLRDWSPPGPGAAGPVDGLAPSGLELVEVPAARFSLGAGGDRFAYDNELPHREVEVEAFKIARVPVTNGEWLAFIDAGGYERREWWSADGWEWRRAERVTLPLRWLDHERERTLRGVGRLVPERPVVHVSFHEAEAFARSHDLRLPTEVEWELAATFDHSSATKQRWPWGDHDPTPAEANLVESALLEPLAAGALPNGVSPCGVLGMIGDVWEWTSSEFRGYPGFRADPYPEYSEVFFGPDHRVLRGGSFATSATVATPTFRNWDYPVRRQIFAGVRVAADR